MSNIEANGVHTTDEVDQLIDENNWFYSDGWFITVRQQKDADKRIRERHYRIRKEAFMMKLALLGFDREIRQGQLLSDAEYVILRIQQTRYIEG
jgi:hypothetical protein